ncbi:hypothetical protein LBMAG56_52030 [Verrucomicrobiota bacterium]|nr:hypothetical protein LBMAG56_52030 [Verrucomicrobiota bacterium]
MGLGINVPFGSDTKWDENGPLRYVTTKSSLAVWNIAPTAAWQVTDELSVGSSLNIYYGETELERHEDFSAFGAPDGRFRLEGDGMAVGATVGLMWRPHVQHTIGIVYRSPFAINFEGTARVNGTPLGNVGPSDLEAEITFPQMVTVGYAYRPVPRLKLEVDVQWINWDTLNAVRLHSPNPAFDGGVLEFDFKDSVLAGVGGEYRLLRLV